MATCDCPQATELPDIPASTCLVDWARVRKFSYSRQQIWQSTSSAASSTVSEIAVASEWTASLAAAGDTKQSISALFGEFAQTPGEPQTTEFDGDTKNTGNYDPTTSAFQFQGASSDQIQEMDKYACEGTLFVIFFDNKNKIIHGFDTTVTTVPVGFPVSPQSFSATDMYQEEAGGFVKSNGSFQLADGWSKSTTVTATLAAFNPLTDLINP